MVNFDICRLLLARGRQLCCQHAKHAPIEDRIHTELAIYHVDSTG